ncbi:hypothetical protein AB751O23_AC_00210 [Chlamydiales bacterium SCGC AB-751-O23]|nr:hypothetical protein AB751O23_AC_00210 [Chlamydiales bacterium SCGC AB-751-O23]
MTKENKEIETVTFYGSGNNMWLIAYLFISQTKLLDKTLPIRIYCVEDPKLENKHPLITLDHKVWDHSKGHLPCQIDFFIKSQSLINLGESYQNFSQKNFHRFDSYIRASNKAEYLQSLRLWNFSSHTKKTQSMYEESFFPHFLSTKFNSFPFKIDNKQINSYFSTGINIDPQKSALILKKYCQDNGAKIIESPLKEVQVDKKGHVSALLFENNFQLKSNLFLDLSFFDQSPLAKAQGIPVHKLPYSFNKQKVLFTKCSYPNRFLPNPSLTNHSLACPNGFLSIHPLFDSVLVAYYCNSEHPTDKMRAELFNFIDKRIDSNFQGPFEIPGGYLENSWKENVVYLGAASYFPSPLFSMNSEISLSSLMSFFSLFPNKNMNPLSQKDYNVQQNSYRETAESLHLLFIYLCHKQGKWPAIKKEEFQSLENDLEYFLDELQATYGGCKFKTPYSFLSPSDFDFLIYGFKENLYAPYPYFDADLWKIFQEKISQEFSLFANICKNVPSQMQIIEHIHKKYRNIPLTMFKK